MAHIGVDCALGYGLKYDGFGFTHLGLIGNPRRDAQRHSAAVVE
jgi:hypothetical protein